MLSEAGVLLSSTDCTVLQDHCAVLQDHYAAIREPGKEQKLLWKEDISYQLCQEAES